MILQCIEEGSFIACSCNGIGTKQISSGDSNASVLTGELA